VGGLGKGGNTYYALDVTDPSAPDENAVAGKVLWEWRNPDNDDSLANFHKLQSAPGYTYGRPVIAKTRAFGWTVIVTGGYNNKSGVGTVYFLNPRTGVPFKTMTTGGGSPANPAGLAQIHAFVKDFRNQIAEQVYGGDLLGNLWRFDVSDANSANWKVDLLAQLKDPGGTPQPVTTAPQIEIDLNNGIDRFVFIGTGQLLDTSDLTTPSPPQPQTMYAIRDGTLAAYQTTGLPIQPRVDMVPINPDGVSAIVGGAPNGWYHDLPSTPPTAERIVVDVQADVNIAAYIGTQAPTDPCVISLPATLYARDYTTGRTLLESGGSPVASITDASGGVGGTLVGRVDPVTHVQSLGWLVSKEVPGSEPRDIINPVTGPGNRLSWRLLTGQ
jgi:type IV pilus assembly protein PilY1